MIIYIWKCREVIEKQRRYEKINRGIYIFFINNKLFKYLKRKIDLLSHIEKII